MTKSVLGTEIKDFHIHLEKDLWNNTKVLAKEDGRTMVGFLRSLLKKEIEKKKEGREP